MDTVYQWMRNIIFYYIFLSAVMNFLPQNSYKPYIRFFMGMLLIILLLSPIMQVFQLKDEFGKNFNKNSLEQAFEESKWNFIYADELQKDYLQEAYQKEIVQKITEYLEGIGEANSEVEVVLEFNSEVTISKINIVLDRDQSEEKIENMKNELEEVYNISKSNINISTKG